VLTEAAERAGRDEAEAATTPVTADAPGAPAGDGGGGTDPEPADDTVEVRS
jgi:hypothetical protein